MNKITFKKPIDSNNFICLWGEMDYIVHTIKGKAAIKKWEKLAIPHYKDGKTFSVCYGNFLKKGGVVYRPLTYKDVSTNRYDFTNQFMKDDYKRVFNLFIECLSM